MAYLNTLNSHSANTPAFLDHENKTSHNLKLQISVSRKQHISLLYSSSLVSFRRGSCYAQFPCQPHATGRVKLRIQFVP